MTWLVRFFIVYSILCIGTTAAYAGGVTIPLNSTLNINTGTLNVAGDITNAGTLTITTGTITLTGNWSNSGTFTAGTGTIVFNGTNQTITGSNTFYNFTKSVTTAGTLTVAAGSTQSIGGTATLKGISGQLLSLRSSSSPTQWGFTLSIGGTKDIDYVDVQDSDASGSDSSLIPIKPLNYTDSGNTIYWFGTILTIVRSMNTISDPINNTTTPLAIPGAVMEYSIVLTNDGDSSPDADSVYLTAPVDSTNEAYDVNTGVSFTDGSTTSALTLGTVTYSSTAAPGPYVYDYTPVPDGQGYDGNVTSIKTNTTGTMAFGGSPSPSFTVKFRSKVE